MKYTYKIISTPKTLHSNTKASIHVNIPTPKKHKMVQFLSAVCNSGGLLGAIHGLFDFAEGSTLLLLEKKKN